jgi:hypothetical protein
MDAFGDSRTRIYNAEPVHIRDYTHLEDFKMWKQTEKVMLPDLATYLQCRRRT